MMLTSDSESPKLILNFRARKDLANFLYEQLEECMPNNPVPRLLKPHDSGVLFMPSDAGFVRADRVWDQMAVQLNLSCSSYERGQMDGRCSRLPNHPPFLSFDQTVATFFRIASEIQTALNNTRTARSTAPCLSLLNIWKNKKKKRENLENTSYMRRP
jgi:hypothetical protein